MVWVPSAREGASVMPNRKVKARKNDRHFFIFLTSFLLLSLFFRRFCRGGTGTGRKRIIRGSAVRKRDCMEIFYHIENCAELCAIACFKKQRAERGCVFRTEKLFYYSLIRQANTGKPLRWREGMEPLPYNGDRGWNPSPTMATAENCCPPVIPKDGESHMTNPLARRQGESSLCLE